MIELNAEFFNSLPLQATANRALAGAETLEQALG
jgi:hypothetical protein